MAGEACGAIPKFRMRTIYVSLLTKAPMTKRKKSKFKAATEARRRARLGIGPPPAARVIPDKRKKPPKYKTQFEKSDSEES